MVNERAEEIRDMSLVLNAELFGDEIWPDEAWSGWTPEYGRRRPADAPLVYAPARLDRIDVVLAQSRVLRAGAVAPASTEDASARRVNQPDDGPALIARRMGWIIALLVAIILILLSGGNRTDGITRIPRQFADGSATDRPA